MIKNSSPHISVCIPTHEMNGEGHIFLSQSLDILRKQSFQDFEVVVSDNAKTDVIREVCDRYENKLSIRYSQNPDPQRGMSSNVNNVIKNAKGKLIKILFLDDFLANNRALGVIAEKFDIDKDSWMATGCEHTKDGKTRFNPHVARYNSEVYIGINTIGSPSVLTIKNEKPLLFDGNLKWLMDCDYYKRCYDSFGEPKIIPDILTVIRVGDHQTTNTEATNALRLREYLYVIKKHEKGLIYWRLKLSGIFNYQLQRIKHLTYGLASGMLGRFKGVAR